MKLSRLGSPLVTCYMGGGFSSSSMTFSPPPLSASFFFPPSIFLLFVFSRDFVMRQRVTCSPLVSIGDHLPCPGPMPHPPKPSSSCSFPVGGFFNKTRVLSRSGGGFSPLLSTPLGLRPFFRGKNLRPPRGSTSAGLQELPARLSASLYQ